MASFTAELPDIAPEKVSRPEPVSINTEISQTIPGAIEGASNVIMQGMGLVAENITADATKATEEAFTTFQTNTRRLSGGITEEARAALVALHGDTINKLQNPALRRLRSLFLEERMMELYGTTKAGRTAVREAMENVTGFKSAGMQVDREIKDEEAVAAKARLSMYAAWETELRNSNIAIPRNKDGSPNVNEMQKIIMIASVTGDSIQSMGKSNGSSKGISGNIRHFPRMAVARKGLYRLFIGQTQTAYELFLNAKTPEERKGAKQAIWLIHNTFEKNALEGKLGIFKKHNLSFASFNPREIEFLFGSVRAHSSRTLKSFGLDSATFNPLTIDKDFAANVKARNDAAIALIGRDILSDENMARVMALNQFGFVKGAAEVMGDNLGSMRNTYQTVGKSIEEAEALANKVFEQALEGAAGVPDLVGLVGLANTLNESGPNVPVPSDIAEKMVQSLVENEDQAKSDKNATVVYKAMLGERGVEVWKSVKESHPELARKAYDSFAKISRKTLNKKLIEVAEKLSLEERKKVSITETGFVEYGGDHPATRKNVEEMNQIVSSSAKYVGLVKEARLLSPERTAAKWDQLMKESDPYQRSETQLPPDIFSLEDVPGVRRQLGLGEGISSRSDLGRSIPIDQPQSDLGRSIPIPRKASGPEASRGIRNNNPGNIKKGPDEWEGAVKGNDESFETFDSAENGIRAMGKTLITYKEKHKIDTLEGVINRWAPPEENDTASYIQFMEDYTGYSRKDKIDLKSPSVLIALTKGIILFENGSDPYTQEVPRGVQLALGKKIDEEGFLSKIASALSPIGSAQAAEPTAEDFAALEAAKGEAGTAEDVVASGGLIQRGAKGGEVQQIQEALGVDTSDGGVGIFGPKTEKAVMEFQKANDDADGNDLVVDGKVGPKTFAAILKKGGQPQSPMALNTETGKFEAAPTAPRDIPAVDPFNPKGVIKVSSTGDIENVDPVTLGTATEADGIKLDGTATIDADKTSVEGTMVTLLPAHVRAFFTDISENISPFEMKYESKTRDETYFSKGERLSIRNLVQNASKRLGGATSGRIDYDKDFKTGQKDVSSRSSKLLGDDEFSVQHTLGDFSWSIAEDGTITIIDRYNFNDAAKVQKNHPRAIDKLKLMGLGIAGLTAGKIGWYGIARGIGSLYGSKEGFGAKFKITLPPKERKK